MVNLVLSVFIIILVIFVIIIIGDIVNYNKKLKNIAVADKRCYYYNTSFAEIINYCNLISNIKFEYENKPDRNNTCLKFEEIYVSYDINNMKSVYFSGIKNKCIQSISIGILDSTRYCALLCNYPTVVIKVIDKVSKKLYNIVCIFSIIDIIKLYLFYIKLKFYKKKQMKEYTKEYKRIMCNSSNFKYIDIIENEEQRKEDEKD